MTDAQLVWWDFDPPSGLPEQRFRFGHRIVIALSASRQEAYARVSFFSTLNFAARLGSAKVDRDQTVIVDIDPLADRPPDDIHETKSERLLAPVARPASLTAGLADEIQQGRAEERFKLLLSNIFSWLLDQTAGELLPQINAARSLDAPMRQQRVREVLGAQQQRVFNLCEGAEGAATRQRGDRRRCSLPGLAHRKRSGFSNGHNASGFLRLGTRDGGADGPCLPTA